MLPRQPRYSKEEFARRGTELFESKIRHETEKGNHGRVVAIDIETGDYELADDTLEACQQLYARQPDAQPFCLRIGHVAVDRFGGQPTLERS
ncbi:MAG TPA: hypothetical protein VE988_17245 [Gemmataceae bacterium]|nr:hypothetical protein [Gemmataceae bacterium]